MTVWPTSWWAIFNPSRIYVTSQQNHVTSWILFAPFAFYLLITNLIKFTCLFYKTIFRNCVLCCNNYCIKQNHTFNLVSSIFHQHVSMCTVLCIPKGWVMFEVDHHASIMVCIARPNSRLQLLNPHYNRITFGNFCFKRATFWLFWEYTPMFILAVCLTECSQIL